MKIVHVNFSDSVGGAAIAVKRFHDLLLKEGIDSATVEKIINEKLKALDDYITDVDFHISVDSVAKVVQPFTDQLLKNL